MKKIRYMFLLILGLVFTLSEANAQIPDDITASLNAGNAASLARHFNQNVELNVLENENVYSKAHAEQVISNFFKNNPPTRFSIIHQGGKGDSRYAIGTLYTKSQNFRVYFLVKSNNNVTLIHHLRIAKQSD